MTPEVRTERLLLRGWQETDKPAYASLNGDPEVMRHFPTPLTVEQSDEMVDRMRGHWASHGFGLWAVERLDTGQFIGFTGLAMPGWSNVPLVEVGWRLSREHWGLGFAPEAARASLAFGFEHVALPADEIVSFTTTKNFKSQRVMQKIGMRHDPTRDFDHPLLPHWHEKAHVFYVIDREMWRVQQGSGVAR
ncbi:MAG TPA: GNAT family N-acetyltransferase [Acidimicrobiaceae bacterium]|nr:GNAT family N-acetyltransferase [Acidimicrobiaceae bacterium]